MTCRDLISYLEVLDGSRISDLDWRDFESHCGTVLRENGYEVTEGICFSNVKRKFQIDIVAAGLKHALCIDCKAWKRGGGRGRSIRASEDQLERTMELRSCLESKGLMHLEALKLYPALVTLQQEDISIHEGVPIVPFEQLNAFLVNFAYYEDELARV
jgi:hypothetical protein